MAVEIATAFVSLVPSAKGIGANIAKELAPIEGAAAATGTRAGVGLGSKLTSGLQKALPSASGPAGALFSSTGALLGGALVVGFGAALVGIAQQFGSARRQIIQETGQTGKELEESFATVKRVFGEVPASIGDVTTAIDLLQQRGVPLGATLDKLATQQLNLAHITGTDVRANVEAATAVMSKYNVSLRDQPAALDAIFKASQASGAGITELLTNMRTGGAALTQFGFGVNESAALLASLTRAGVNVTPALAGLRKAFGQLAKEGQDPKKALQDLIHEFDAGQDPAKAMGDAIKLFGSRSGVELATAIQQGKFSFEDLLKTITNGKGGINATAESTRTLGEKFEILKNQTILALEPLGSALWAQLKVLIGDIIPPAENLVRAIANLAKGIAPLAAAVAGVFLVAFEATLPILDSFATGIQAIADFLGLIPTPVLIAAGALAVLAKAFFVVRDAIVGIQVISALGGNFTALLSPITLVVAGIVALGAAIKIFGGQESAAAKEAKDLNKALFDTSTGTGVFASGITSASKGFGDFLAKASDSGKFGNLNDVLATTGASVKDVASAVTGTTQDFDRLKSTLSDTSALKAQQKATTDVGQSFGAIGGALGDFTSKQGSAALAAAQTTEALQQQRDAFVQSAEAQFKAVAQQDQGNAGLVAQARAIANATSGTRGYGAALDFLNAGLGEQAAKQDAANLKAAAQKGTLDELRASVISGAITTDDATGAASRFGLTLEQTKKVISDTSDELKSFVESGLSGLPGTSDAVNEWAGTVKTAFQGVADAAKGPPDEVKKAQDALNKATDPTVLVANMQAQAKAIADFSFNIQALLGAGLTDAVKSLLANPDKQAAGLVAASLVNKPAIAKQFNEAAGALTEGTNQFSALLQGPLAQQLLVSSSFAAAGMTAGFTQNLNLTDPTAAQAAGANNALTAATPAIVQSAQTMSSEAFNAYVNSLGIGAATQQQTDAIQAALKAGVAPAGANAGAVGTSATGGFAGALGLPGAAAGNLSAATQVFTGQERINMANSARETGRLVGVAFDQGLRQGIRGDIPSVEQAARDAVQAAVQAARSAGGIASPSRVTRELGRFLIQGFALGITENAGLSANAAAAVVGQTTDAFVTGRVGSAGVNVRSPNLSAGAVQTGGVVNLTVQSLDPRTAAPVVIAALEKYVGRNAFVPVPTAGR